MNYTNTYGYDKNFDSEGSAYDESLAYHPNAPLFTEQELSGFDLVQQHLAQNCVPINSRADVDMGTTWECEPSVKMAGYGGYRDMVPQFYHEEEPSVYDMSMEYHKSSDFYRYSECDLVGSCQTSPFVDPSRLPFEPSSFLQPSLPVSPVTPSGSPSQYGGCHNPAVAAAPPALLLVPSESSGHYHYNAYQVPMPDACMNQFALQHHPLLPFQSQRPSLGSVPSLDASPAISEAPATDSSCDDDDDDDEDEDEDDDDGDVLPNHGNTELRGMGLYDDAPDLLYSVPSPSGGCSPVTPHDQLRPTLGRGLVLERSFGLPEKMMLKDETSGEIVEGKLEVEDDMLLEPWNSPALYTY
jgi:hypothetical protein